MRASLKGMLSALPRPFGANQENILRVKRKSDSAERPPPVVPFCFLEKHIPLLLAHIAGPIRRAVSVGPKNPRSVGEIVACESAEWVFSH